LSARRIECQPGRGNVQHLVIFLYQLLEEKCECDFKVEKVLNSYTASGHPSSTQEDF
jgi:hypothetical protein